MRTLSTVVVGVPIGLIVAIVSDALDISTTGGFILLASLVTLYYARDFADIWRNQ